MSRKRVFIIVGTSSLIIAIWLLYWTNGLTIWPMQLNKAQGNVDTIISRIAASSVDDIKVLRAAESSFWGGNEWYKLKVDDPVQLVNNLALGERTGYAKREVHSNYEDHVPIWWSPSAADNHNCYVVDGWIHIMVSPNSTHALLLKVGH